MLYCVDSEEGIVGNQTMVAVSVVIVQAVVLMSVAEDVVGRAGGGFRHEHPSNGEGPAGGKLVSCRACYVSTIRHSDIPGGRMQQSEHYPLPPH